MVMKQFPFFYRSTKRAYAVVEAGSGKLRGMWGGGGGGGLTLLI